MWPILKSECLDNLLIGASLQCTNLLPVEKKVFINKIFSVDSVTVSVSMANCVTN